MFKGVRPVGVQDRRNRRMLDHSADERRRMRIARNPRPDRDYRHGLQQFFQTHIGAAGRVATVDNPAPGRKAAMPAMDTDRALPTDPPITSTCPKLPLLESAGRA